MGDKFVDLGYKLLNYNTSTPVQMHLHSFSIHVFGSVCNMH